jgi:hypothetical protein
MGPVARALGPWFVGLGGPAMFAFACACEAVPTLTFAEGDAATPDVEDASDDADSANDRECTGDSAPQAAFVCCGAVMCQGPCTGQCGTCTTKCTGGQVCCAKTNNVVCFAAGTVCK